MLWLGEAKCSGKGELKVLAGVANCFAGSEPNAFGRGSLMIYRGEPNEGVFNSSNEGAQMLR